MIKRERKLEKDNAEGKQRKDLFYMWKNQYGV